MRLKSKYRPRSRLSGTVESGSITPSAIRVLRVAEKVGEIVVSREMNASLLWVSSI